MDKFKEIRPVVLGIVTKNNKLLVGEGYDKIKNQTFYRCLGGGIEFGEKSFEALKREFQEEIQADIIVKDFLGISENIFVFNGKKGHELVILYKAEMKDYDYKEEYHIADEEDSGLVKWVDVNEFKNKEKILYPVEVLEYI